MPNPHFMSSFHSPSYLSFVTKKKKRQRNQQQKPTRLDPQHSYYLLNTASFLFLIHSNKNQVCCLPLPLPRTCCRYNDNKKKTQPNSADKTHHGQIMARKTLVLCCLCTPRTYYDYKEKTPPKITKPNRASKTPAREKKGKQTPEYMYSTVLVVKIVTLLVRSLCAIVIPGGGETDDTSEQGLLLPTRSLSGKSACAT